MTNTLLIFGYGYTAKMVVKMLDKSKWKIYGTSRQVQEQDNKFQQVEILDFKAQDVERIIDSVTHILITTPPDNVHGDPTLHEFKETIMHKSTYLKWIGYLSSTSVYGNHNGDWVNETTPVKIENERSRVRFEAELYWLSLGRRINAPTQIFRLSSIYGLERNPLRQLIDNKARIIDKEGQFFSRIHVEDIANILIASMHNPMSNEIFNLCDDLPCSSCAPIKYAASLLQIPPPLRIPFENAEMSEMAQEFYNSNRRVRNSKVKEMLSISLRYPTYKEGLYKMFKDEIF